MIDAVRMCVLIGQIACRLLELPREAIDRTRVRASGNLHSAATRPILLVGEHKIIEKSTYQSVTRSNELFKIYNLGSHQCHFSFNMVKFQSNYVN